LCGGGGIISLSGRGEVSGMVKGKSATFTSFVAASRGQVHSTNSHPQHSLPTPLPPPPLLHLSHFDTLSPLTPPHLHSHPSHSTAELTLVEDRSTSYLFCLTPSPEQLEPNPELGCRQRSVIDILCVLLLPTFQFTSTR
jgi:hypothetical protein